MGPKAMPIGGAHDRVTNDHRTAPTTTDPTAPDPTGPTRRVLRRALVRAAPRLVAATSRARTDRLADLDALADWTDAYGHDLLVFHRVDLDVVRRARGADAALDRFEAAMHAEHDELAAAALEAGRALRRWARQAGGGRAALAAMRIQLDDLVVHEAHEAPALDVVLTPAGLPLDLDLALHDALTQAPLHEPPFLGPLALADADPTERQVLLDALPAELRARWTAAEAAHAEATRRAMGA